MDNKQEKAWQLLRLEDRLYGQGYDQEQVENILEYAYLGNVEDIKDELEEPYTGQVKINGWKLGTMAVGGLMLAGLIYAISALYTGCTNDQNDSRMIQGPKYTTIEQLTKYEMRK